MICQLNVHHTVQAETASYRPDELSVPKSLVQSTADHYRVDHLNVPKPLIWYCSSELTYQV